jgi:hypothetical protein
MLDQVLIDKVVAKFKLNEHSDQIREDLQEEGYTSGDIDAAFRHIRYSALQQIPVVANFTNWLDTLDTRTSNLPPNKLLMVFGAIGIFILVTAASLYFIFDPLGTRASQRDEGREQSFIQLRNAIEKFNTDQHHYPKDLTELVPNYIPNIPQDPRTKVQYDYKILDTAGNYQLCVNFETQNSQCIASKEDLISPDVTEGVTPTANTVSDNAYTLNGRVYTDTNKDGKIDPEESLIGNIAVIISDTSGKQVCSTTTSNDGIYTCSLQLQGNYTVTVAIPKGMKAAQNTPLVVAVPNNDYPEMKAATVDFGIAPATSSPVQSTPDKAVKK